MPWLETLVRISRLRSQRNDAESLINALNILMDDTYHVSWYNDIVRSLKDGHERTIPRTDWRERARDNYNAEARNKREAYHKASATQDLSLIAQASIDEGLWHIHGGDFRSAHSSFNAAKTADPERKMECIYYSVQLDLLQDDNSHVSTVVGKLFPRLIESQAPYCSEILLSYAYALWKLHDFSSAAIVFLHVVGHSYSKENWPWLSRQASMALCVVCCILSLSRENLEYFALSDMQAGPLLDEISCLRSLITCFLDVNIEGFWTQWNTVKTECENDFSQKDLTAIQLLLKEKLLRNYLYVRSKCLLTDVLGSFGYDDSLQFAAEARELDLPIEIDTVTGVVHVVVPESENQPEETYVEDVIVTIWNSIEARFGPGLEPPPPRIGIDSEGLMRGQRFRHRDIGKRTPRESSSRYKHSQHNR